VLPPITALNPTQADYLDALRSTSHGRGCWDRQAPARLGSPPPTRRDLYRSRHVSKIILTRPNVPCGRSLGFFPGSLEDKFAPLGRAGRRCHQDRIGKAAYEIALKRGDIEMVPFEVMRGRSWKEAFVLLDEAQNTTPAEIKTFLTRVGEDCLVVINGDVGQMRRNEASGPRHDPALIQNAIAAPCPSSSSAPRDIVRSDLCAMWVRAFDEAHL